jgi:Ser/Thr protein kinase RdoA (MazF antagonist)
MGITTYLFHKSNSLEQQRFNMFFLDMGENIHFHYRDLRIELSVGEFKELANLFVQYSREVLAEIEAGYQDGVFANTNEADTLKTFWNKEKNLTFPVKYHERHLAVEETKDGYHLHIRNYKILLQKDSFKQLVQAIAQVLPLLEHDDLKRDPVQLMQDNELATKCISRLQTEEHEEIVIEVEKIFKSKAGQVLKALGYVAGSMQDGKIEYTKPGSTVLLVPPGLPIPLSCGGATNISYALPTFLAKFGDQVGAADLNQLKLKILTLLKMAITGQIAPFKLEDLYINRESFNPAVDLFSGQREIDSKQELENFNNLLAEHKLFFIKPDKEFFPPDRQNAAEDAFFDFVMKKLAPHECVRKIYLLGSSKNHRSGRYQVPFVHFDWAKLNSDFDIYIELDPDCSTPVPTDWEKKFYWQRAGCDYYHFGDVGDGATSEFAKLYPAICFYEHLVEGYVFNPTTGHRSKKDAWFAETKARCIFSRDKVADWINERYNLEAQSTERFNVASFNRVYHVASRPHDYVLKIYDSKYLTQKNQEKIAYEIGLLDFLKDSGLEIALPVKNKNGKYISKKDQEQAVLFTFAPGKYIAAPNRNEIFLAGNLLARFHDAARHFKTKNATIYSNKNLPLYWLLAWNEYHNQGGIVGTDISLDVEHYTKRLHALSAHPTHCHGDLSVINYLFDNGKCYLIDFQSVGYGPALLDLTNGMVEFAAGKKVFEMDHLQYFKDGYESVRKLLPVEEDNINDLLIIQTAVRQAKLLRLHYGSFGYDLKEDRIIGLRMGLENLQAR